MISNLKLWFAIYATNGMWEAERRPDSALAIVVHLQEHPVL
jgi:hypothetical protein